MATMDKNFYNKIQAQQKAMGFNDNRTYEDIQNYVANNLNPRSFNTNYVNNSRLNDTNGSYNRNFSALNYAPIDDKSYSAIYGNSSDPRKRNTLLTTPNSTGNNRPNTYVDPSNRLPKPIGTNTGGTPTPPNQKNNLLNYLVSPKGRGMAQGLLEASGYSDVPITAGQALAMGLKRSNESQAAADASVAAQQKAYMDNLKIQSEIYKNYQPSGNPKDQYRPMTAEDYKTWGIPTDMPMRFNISKNKPETLTGGGTKIEVDIDQSDKGTESWFKSRGDAFSKTVDTLSSGADAADIDNQSLARFVQLSELAKTGKTAELLADMQGWADSLGVDLSGLDLANMGATQALNSVAGRFVMQQVQKTKGAVSDREMAYFMKISANIGNSPLGNQLIVNMAQSMNGRVIEENNLLNNYLDEMYEKDPNMSAYALERGWKKIQQKFRDENQLFQGDIKDEIKAYYDDNDIKYTDSTKVIEDTLKDYPNAEYMGVDEDDKLQFKIYKDGKYQYFSVGA